MYLKTKIVILKTEVEIQYGHVNKDECFDLHVHVQKKCTWTLHVVVI